MVIKKPITTLQLETIAKRYDHLINFMVETILSLPINIRLQIVNKIITEFDGKSPEEKEILRPVIDDLIIIAAKHKLNEN